MKAAEIRDLADDELVAEAEKAREKIFRMRFQAKGKDIENPGAVIKLKKQIARYLTVIRERELAAERAAEAERVAEAEGSGTEQVETSDS